MVRKNSKNRKLKSASKIPLKAFTEAAASSAVPPPPPPPWIELSDDLTANILGRLGVEEILKSAQSVCTTWWKVCQDPAMWRVIYLSCFEDEEQYTALCRRAVDRSQGQLVDLTLDCFGDDELIDYIADRSSNLKRLTLRFCYISGECLAKAVKKFPHLEELHLYGAPVVGDVDVKNIGISCPKLKSFSFNVCSSWTEYAIEDVAMIEGIDLAIGKSMPNLRHLQLFANQVRNPGLKAILDGCPHLESLDIRECFELDLGGDLGKRCRDQIKDLKLPSDDWTSDPWRLANETSDWRISYLPRLANEPSERHSYEYDVYYDQS